MICGPPARRPPAAWRILVDRSSVEVFGGHGEAVITDQISPDQISPGHVLPDQVLPAPSSPPPPAPASRSSSRAAPPPSTTCRRGTRRWSTLVTSAWPADRGTSVRRRPPRSAGRGRR
ncbi:GH32 C-terminal domain-containing protein [Streptomyces sp. NPDC057623]|uniref:GH32 C-terminal domain-containing protein n=1 Tax=Streptomyces sp. NPDC057623 TaxID=3346187 RepID=UPI0036BFCABB